MKHLLQVAGRLLLIAAFTWITIQVKILLPEEVRDAFTRLIVLLSVGTLFLLLLYGTKYEISPSENRRSKEENNADRDKP